MSFNEQWKLHLSGRYTKCDTREYNPDGSQGVHYDKNEFTPNAALLFKPRQETTNYLSYMEDLQGGSAAPVGTSKQLTPLTSKEWKISIKNETNPHLLAEVAVSE